MICSLSPQRQAESELCNHVRVDAGDEVVRHDAVAPTQFLGLSGGGRLELHLKTVTPGFARFLAAKDGGGLEPVSARCAWDLKPGRNEIRLVAENRQGVRGPVTRLVVEDKKVPGNP